MRTVKILITSLLFSMAATGMAEEVTDAKISALSARMQEIEQALNNQALLDMAQRVATLQREVRELRGENERLLYELNSIKTLQREQYLALERRLQSGPSPSHTAGSPDGTALGQTVDTAIPESPGEEVSPVAIPSEPAAETLSGQVVSPETASEVAEDYKNAFTLLKSGKYDDSIATFESFLRKHPDSKYAANAQYWLAEANYVTRRYPQALVEFSVVVSKYPASPKLADARLKLAFTHYELGQFEEARAELTRLRAQFPNSSVASLAQKRLERMSREGN